MDNKKRKSGELDVSQISHISNGSIREQPSQLDINVNGYLHSTFNYPLHSTVNFMDMSLDLSKTIVNESDTMTDSKYTMGSHNVNVIGGSTVHTEERSGSLANDTTITGNPNNSRNKSNNDSKNRSARDKSKLTIASDTPTNTADSTKVKSAEKQSLKSSREVSSGPAYVQQPLTEELLKTFDEKMKQTQNWVKVHEELNWAGECDSDCDSSCLSFNVDEVSFSLDDTVAEGRNLSPQENLEKKAAATCSTNVDAVPCITDIISQHLWGSYERSNEDLAVGNGTCDVCNLLRLKRQRGCTDLWTNPGNPPRDDQSSWFDHCTTVTSNNNSALSFVDKFSTAHELLHDKLSRRKRPLPVGESFYETPKRRNTMPESLRTPAAQLQVRSRKSASKSRSEQRRKQRSQNQGVVDTKIPVSQPINPALHERLAPEGSDDKENNPRFTMPPSRSSNKKVSQRKSVDFSVPVTQKLSDLGQKNSLGVKKVSPSNQSAINSCVKSKVSARDVYRTVGECFGTYSHNALEQSTCATPGYLRTQQTRRGASKNTVKSYSDLPVSQSPWATDNKELKRRMKRLSRSLQSDKENVHLQPLGCI